MLGVSKMKDEDGDTPLHLTAQRYHFKLPAYCNVHLIIACLSHL